MALILRPRTGRVGIAHQRSPWIPHRWAMPTLQLLSFTDIFTAVIHPAQGDPHGDPSTG